MAIQYGSIDDLPADAASFISEVCFVYINFKNTYCICIMHKPITGTLV